MSGTQVENYSGDAPTASWSKRVKLNARKAIHKATSKDGLLGDYDYAFLFTPSYPFREWLNRRRGIEPVQRDQPFFSVYSEMPILLGLLLGLQHALAMLAGVITPPIIISSVANFPTNIQQYLVSASLIVSAIMSCIQITRIHIPKTPYYIGSGLLSVVGTSFATITIVDKAFPVMYASGFCPTGADGEPGPCYDGYGALLGTAACCALLEMAMSFTPPKILHRLFPKIVTGPVVLCIAISLIQSGFNDWVGGSGCVGAICPSEGAPMAGEWGSARFIGLGFLVFSTIVCCEKWGSPIMRSCAVIVGLIIGCIVAAACGYFDRSSIDSAPAATFLWVHTFPLKVYGPIVLPMLVMYIVLAQECIGDVTATCDVSRMEVEGEMYESRIQGAVLSDGLSGTLSALFTLPPMSTFAQNNGVISLTKCANRQVGYWCCFFLLLMGIFAKFGAALVAIPKPVLGGMTTFLFTSVAVSGLKIISTIPFTRRDRFVLTGTLLFGLGAILVPNWFETFFHYKGNNDALQGFLNAIILIMESGFAVAGIVGIILNLIIPQQLDEDLMDEIEVQQDNLAALEDPVDGQVLNGKAKEAFSRENDMARTENSYEMKGSRVIVNAGESSVSD
ncbi:LAME_0H02872g1_1 [Lachancea meyersii CBS 8951]|uniref:LAME_0H02872g1_1 n=1 Tax=Lachancea meyersii CBS 8951 TaxID=1266667 RepID=A0A1G4KDH7_9SACH|nr:LAME_0H02872g1_1 [Lachancea meyersii CBS 8951]